MADYRVLVTSYFLHPGDDVDRKLQAAGCETIFNPWKGGRTEEDMIALLPGMDAIIPSIDPMTARVIESADRLKVIARTGVGYDTVDVAAATARGIAVCNTAGVNRHAVAEFAIALMLACSRNLVPTFASVPQGSWARYEGFDLAGKTLGIVGLGTIGKEVAQRMRAFEMKILASDPVQDMPFAEANGVSYVSLEELLRESDLVTIHSLLNAKTHHLINAERLALMKPTAYIINTSRGGLIDPDAIYQTLKDKRIAGAALDVFEEEPLGESPLRGLDNAILTPHAAGSSHDPHSQSGLIAAENALRWLRGERPLHIVNPEVLPK